MEGNFLSHQNSTYRKLKIIRKQLIKLSGQYARMKNIERKQDTRRKIQLGGLVKKAGLGDESTAILLGMLLEASEELNSPNAIDARKRWRLKGDLHLTLSSSVESY